MPTCDCKEAHREATTFDGLIPPVHPNCRCMIDAFGWHVINDGDVCEFCDAAALVWNTTYALSIKKALESKKQEGKPMIERESIREKLDVVEYSLEREMPTITNGDISGRIASFAPQKDGHVLTKGALDKSMTEGIGKIPLTIRHTPSTSDSSVVSTVGFLKNWSMDDLGYNAEFDWLADDVSQSIRAKAMIGGAKYFSVGLIMYRRKPDPQTGILNILEARLSHVAITNQPQDVLARVELVRESSAPSIPEVVIDTHEDYVIRQRIINSIKSRFN